MGKWQKGAALEKAVASVFRHVLYQRFYLWGRLCDCHLYEAEICGHSSLAGRAGNAGFTALAQSSPGAIAVNAAILVGLKICGAAGMAAAVLGTILPPMIILSVVSFFYSAFSSNLFVALALKGMQAGVAAVILDVAWDLGEGMVKKKSLYLNLILAGAFAADLFLGVNVIYIILAAAGAGILRAVLQKKDKKEGRAPCDLFTAFFQLFKGGNVQCRRRLCGHSADPEPGSRSLRVADDG